MPHSDSDQGGTAGVTAAALALCEAALARADAATPGPWRAYGDGRGGWEMGASDDGYRVLASRSPWDHYAEKSIANSEFIEAARADVPLLATIAAAAVRLVEFQRDRGSVEGWPWWGWQGEDGAGCYGCLGSDDDLDNPIGDGAEWDEFPHADGCRAVALDLAIAKLAGE